MTAIKDAMMKAGIDTAAAELRKLAQEALKFNRGNINVAADKFTTMLMKRRDLVASLALQYLQKIAAEPEVVTALAAAAAENRPKNVKVKQHQRHRKRTTAEREAALRVAGMGVDAVRDALGYRVNGRPVGSFAWGELGTMVMENARDAASYLRLGTEATANALLLFKIKNHASVDDHEMTIGQVISPADMQVMIDEAYVEAPRVVEIGMHNYAKTVAEGTRKEIAA